MEIKFSSDTKYRKEWLTGLHFAHPAKMHLSLQLWLIDRYTKEGEVILDPMAGSGTILVACSTGRNVICVELEDKFVKMMNGNWGKIQQRGCQLGYQMGTATILQGDARNLKEVIYGNTDCSSLAHDISSIPIGEDSNKVDKIITSPPYAETMASGGSAVHPLITGKGTTRGRGYSSFGDLAFKEYAPSPDNIGNLPYGKLADVIMTSPPYGIPATSQESSRGEIERRISKGIKGAVITEKGECMTGNGKRQQRYSDNPNNLGNLPYGNIDCVITSPPYERVVKERGADNYAIIEEKGLDMSRAYSENQNNIGNLKGESYLSTMLEVYQGCWRVLKPQGLMILVTKNFIRNKQEIRLDFDTIRLCEQAGFRFAVRHYRKLTSQSFWRTIYQQKYPDAPILDKEDILVFQK